jgi:hypothetical protein
MKLDVVQRQIPIAHSTTRSAKRMASKSIALPAARRASGRPRQPPSHPELRSLRRPMALRLIEVEQIRLSRR